jgi:hypothetical protein
MAETPKLTHEGDFRRALEDFEGAVADPASNEVKLDRARRMVLQLYRAGCRPIARVDIQLLRDAANVFDSDSGDVRNQLEDLADRLEPRASDDR